jgi:hypothetical protein
MPGTPAESGEDPGGSAEGLLGEGYLGGGYLCSKMVWVRRTSPEVAIMW